MATQRRLKDDENENSSVWEIPPSQLPDRASDIWGRCPDRYGDDVTAATPPRPAVKPVAPHRRTSDERVAAHY